MARTLGQFDNQWRRERGVELIGGVDEAGRGALAGPVVAACVVLAPGTRLTGCNDSKQLSPEQREALITPILSRAAAWGVGWATAAEIDEINILQATIRAAYRAMSGLPTRPELLLTDFLKLPDCGCEFVPLVDGDALSQAIAAASILAKVARDRLMRALDGEYPVYGFASHKGYGTPGHWERLNAHGPSTIHRLTYNGVCFFDVEPPVRALGGPRRRCPGQCGCPTPDWSTVLTCETATLDGRDYLPECEWLEEALALSDELSN